MDQHLSDAWLALQEDSESSAETGKVMERFPAGHAWFVLDDDEGDQAILLACERRERLEPLLKHVELNLRVRSITVMIDEVAVPVVVVMLRIPGTDEPTLFSAWVNELSQRTPGILERLAEQPQLMIAMIDENGRTVGTSQARNVLAAKIESQRGWIENLARTSPWTRHQFAAAKTYIRSQHPSNEDLWERFDEDSASGANDREFQAVPA